MEAGNYDPYWHRKWFETLRSGEYKQGRAALRREDDSFCCIGVVADMIDPSLWVKAHRVWEWVYPHLESEFYNDANIPNSVARRYGLISWVGVTLNDDGWSFDEIADAYEVMIP
jgi:hypothetical protein